MKEYDLGIIVSSEDDIYSKIMIYARSFDPIQFQKIVTDFRNGKIGYADI